MHESFSELRQRQSNVHLQEPPESKLTDIELTRLLEGASTVLSASVAVLARQKIGTNHLVPFVTWQSSAAVRIDNRIPRSPMDERRALFRAAPSAKFGALHPDLALSPANEDNGRHAVHFRLGIWSSRQWILSLYRDRGEAPFSQQDFATAAQLLGMLKHSFSLWRRIQSTTQRLTGLETVVNAHNCGIILLDSQRRLLFTNRQAELLLDSADCLLRSQSTITTARVEDALHLQVAIDHVLAQPRQDRMTAVEGAPLLCIERPRARPLFIAVVRVDAPSSGLLRPAVALYIVDPDTDVLGSLTATCQLYKLTAAETRLVKHVIQGMTLAEACIPMGIKLPTARAYLRQIFTKVGVCRQADLVRVMLASLIRLRTVHTAAHIK